MEYFKGEGDSLWLPNNIFKNFSSLFLENDIAISRSAKLGHFYIWLLHRTKFYIFSVIFSKEEPSTSYIFSQIFEEVLSPLSFPTLWEYSWVHLFAGTTLTSNRFYTFFADFRENSNRFFNYFRISVKLNDELAEKILDKIKSRNT